MKKKSEAVGTVPPPMASRMLPLPFRASFRPAPEQCASTEHFSMVYKKERQ